MATERGTRAARLSAVRRHEERVTALELFFDLVFVLAITQCRRSTSPRHATASVTNWRPSQERSSRRRTPTDV